MCYAMKAGTTVCKIAAILVAIRVLAIPGDHCRNAEQCGISS